MATLATATLANLAGWHWADWAVSKTAKTAFRERCQKKIQTTTGSVGICWNTLVQLNCVEECLALITLDDPGAIHAPWMNHCLSCSISERFHAIPLAG